NLYRPFKKDYPVRDLVEAVHAAIGDATGAPGKLERGSELRASSGKLAVSWNGDENLLLLTARNLARILIGPSGPIALRLRAWLRDRTLGLEISQDSSNQRKVQIGEDYLQARAFAKALGARLKQSSYGHGDDPAFTLELPGILIQKEAGDEAAL